MNLLTDHMASEYSIEDFVNYIFLELSEEEQDKMDNYLDMDQEANQLVHILMDFCKEKQLFDKTSFELHFEDQRDALLAKIKPRLDASAVNRTVKSDAKAKLQVLKSSKLYTFLRVAAAVLILIITGVTINELVLTETLGWNSDELENAKSKLKIHLDQYGDLAGGSGIEEFEPLRIPALMKAGLYKKAVDYGERMMPAGCNLPKHRYEVGMAYLLYLDDPRKSIGFLTCAADGSSEAAEYRHSAQLHLVIAHTIIGDIKAAESFRERYELELEELPSSIQMLLQH